MRTLCKKKQKQWEHCKKITKKKQWEHYVEKNNENTL